MYGKKGIACCAVLAIALSLGTRAVFAASASYANTLTGNWGGARNALVRKGVDLNLYYTGDFAHNLTGGVRNSSAYASGFELVGAFNLDKLIGWKGGSFHLDVANFDGTLLADKAHLGSLLSTQQIFAGHATYVANFYWQQSLWKGLLHLKYGRMDLVANFFSTPVITQFENTTFFGPQPGVMASEVTVWPTSSVGEALTVHPTRAWSFTVANLAVQPNNQLVPSEGVKPWNRGHRIGNVAIAQAKVLTDFPASRDDGAGAGAALHGMWMIGGWHNSAPQPDLLLNVDGQPRTLTGEAALIRRSAGGVYLTGQQEVTRNAAGGGLLFFANFVHADSNVTLIDQMESLGAVYNAPFTSRPNDSIAFAIGRNGVSPRAVELARIENESRTGKPSTLPGAEYVAELNYVVQLPRGISVMPNLQYVDHPGGLGESPDYTVFGVQLGVTF
ncbi:MAG: carbohydrate porin [Rhodanobacteraceae bacterium]